MEHGHIPETSMLTNIMHGDKEICLSGDVDWMFQRLSCSYIIIHVPLSSSLLPDGSWIQLSHYAIGSWRHMDRTGYELPSSSYT